MITAIQIYLIGKESTKRMMTNTDRRNQVKNQKPNEGIHLTVRVTIRKEVKIEGVPVVAIGLKRQRNPRNIKEEIRNEKGERIKYQDP